MRGSVCDHEDELVALWKKIEADPRIEIVRTKNRFNPPLFNGYRDIMMNVAVDVGYACWNGLAPLRAPDSPHGN